jgi:hypothetical protein
MVQLHACPPCPCCVKTRYDGPFGTKRLLCSLFVFFGTVASPVSYFISGNVTTSENDDTKVFLLIH